MNKLENSYQTSFDLVVYLRKHISVDEVVIYPLSWNNDEFYIGFRNTNQLNAKTLYDLLTGYNIEGWQIDESVNTLLDMQYCENNMKISYHRIK